MSLKKSDSVNDVSPTTTAQQDSAMSSMESKCVAATVRRMRTVLSAIPVMREVLVERVSVFRGVLPVLAMQRAKER